VLGSYCAGNNMMTNLAIVFVHKLSVCFHKLKDVINLPPVLVTCNYTAVSLKAFYDLLLKLTWARFFASFCLVK
jgi:hypothetical protein